MPREQIRRRLAHDAGDMFDLVADIERYPEFVPGCRSIRVLRREGEGAVRFVIVEMRIGYRLITERFTCRVKLDRPALAIDVEFIDGPFTALSNAWRFHEMGACACEVDFTIDFELKSHRLGMLVATLFDRVFLRFVDAFERRADALLSRHPPRQARPARA